MDKKSFGTQLKNLRKSADITQEELAEKLNVHVQTISKWEREISKPDIALLGELAKILSVSLEELLDVEKTQVYSGTFTPEALGKKIKQLRHKSGEEQKELAATLNVSPDIISKWERAVICPTVEDLIALSEHYDLPLSKLYYGIQDHILTSHDTPNQNKKRFIKLLMYILIPIALAGIAIGVYFGCFYHKHNFGEWRIIIEPTCEATGLRTRKCSECGYIEASETGLGKHVEVHFPAVAPTCTQWGYTEGSFCSICGESIVKEEMLPPTGHDVKDGRCTKCGKEVFSP